MNPLAAYGLLAHGLIFGALVALLPLGPLRARAALIATALALLVGIAPLMHGSFGPPSLTLLQLALLQHAGRSSPLSWRPALGLLLGALIFYPLALGGGSFDPYALGYQPRALLGGLLALAGILYWRRRNLWLLILAIDLAAYAGGLFANLWDALFDPLLVGLALLVVGRQLVVRLIASRIR
ncbi:MAG: hypothetical protein WAV95_03850 [Azonexus sp.]